MKVAIIGNGNMATGLAGELAAANVKVVIGSRDSSKAVALAQQIGKNTQRGGIAAAFKLADIAILALPYGVVATKTTVNQHTKDR